MNGIAELSCNTTTKDCDFWNTASIDPITQDLYFQAHDVSEGDDDPIASLVKFQYLQGRIAEITNCFVIETFVQFEFYRYHQISFLNFTINDSTEF